MASIVSFKIEYAGVEQLLFNTWGFDSDYTSTKYKDLYPEYKHISTYNPVIVKITVSNHTTVNNAIGKYTPMLETVVQFHDSLFLPPFLSEAELDNENRKHRYNYTVPIYPFEDINATTTVYYLYLDDIIRNNPKKSSINDYMIDENTVSWVPEMLHRMTITVKRLVPVDDYYEQDILSSKCSIIQNHNIARQYSQSPYINIDKDINFNDTYIGAHNLPVYIYCFNNDYNTQIIINKVVVYYVLDNDEAIFSDNDSEYFVY